MLAGRRVKLCASVAGLTALLTVASGVTAHRAGAEEAPLKIGEFLDFTGGGASAAEAARLGIGMAVEEINKAGGVAGRKLTVVTGDTQTDPTIGVGEAKRLIQEEKVGVLFGPVISQVLMAALPVINQAKIAEMGSTGSEQITPRAGPYYFSLLINAASQAKAMVTQAQDTLHAKSGAIISDSGAQSQSFVQSMKQEMQARGMKLTGVQQYQYRSTDMTPQLLTLKRGSPDVLFLFASSGEDAGNILKSLDDVGWEVKVTGNYTIATFAPAALKIAGADSFHDHDVTGIAYKAFTYCDPQDLPKPFASFVQRAQAYRPEEAKRLSLPFAATLYDGVQLMMQAVAANAGSTDGAVLAKWIEANAKNYRGIISDFSASPSSHFLVGPGALAAVYPDRVRDGGMQQRYGCSKGS